MDAEQLQPIFLLELPLLLHELVLLALLLHARVLLQDLLVVQGCLRQQALVHQPLHVLEDEQRGDYLWVFLSCHGLDLVDESFDLDGGVVLDIAVVLADHEDLSQPHSASVQHVHLLAQSLHLHLVQLPSALQGLPVPGVLGAEGLLGQVDVADLVLLDVLGRERVLSVQLLQQVVLAVSDRAVVLDHDVLQRLHQLTLDVARSGGLDCRVRQALTASHRVEEELVRLESLVERAEHEPSGFWRVVVLAEVRERSPGKSKRTPSSIDVLVAQTKHDLGQVGLRSFTLGGDHLVDAVEIGRDLLGYDLLHGRQPVVEVHVDVVLEGIEDLLAPLMQVLADDLLLVPVLVEDAVVELVYLVYLVYDVRLELFIRHAISRPHCEGIRHQPVIHDSLGDRHELVGGVGADVQPDGVHESSCARTHHFLLQCARQELPFADDHGGVVPVAQAVLALPDLDGDLLGDDHAHDLLAGPQRLGLENGRHRQLSRLQLVVALPLALLAVDPDHQVHHFFPREEGVSHREEIDAQQCVLHDTHDGRVVLGGNDLLGNVGDVLKFRDGLVGLRDVHVHLIAVKFGVVGRADGQVESEGVVRKDPDPVAHHTHAMQRWLTVEKHVVPVLEVALDDHAVVEVLFYFVLLVVHLHEVYDVVVLLLVLGRLQDVFHLALHA